MINVYLIEDSFFVRDAYKNLIAHDPRAKVCGEASQVEEALGELETLPVEPDVIVLDINFIEKSGEPSQPKGIGAIRRIREMGLQSRILCISDEGDPHIVLKAIHSDANGYMDKNEVKEQLVNAIVKVHDGAFMITSTIAELAIGAIDSLSVGNATILRDTNGQTLPPRRAEIAELAFRFGLSPNAIARELNLSIFTVREHIKLIRKDLGAVAPDDIVLLLTKATSHNNE